MTSVHQLTPTINAVLVEYSIMHLEKGMLSSD